MLPPHPYDYEPVYVYLKDGRLDKVAFDYFHYKVAVKDRQDPLMILGPWHGFSNMETTPERTLSRRLISLDNTILGELYDRKGEARFIIRQKLTDPWLLRDGSTFRDEGSAFDIRYVSAMPLKAADLTGLDETVYEDIDRELFRLTVANINRLSKRVLSDTTINKMLTGTQKRESALKVIRLYERTTRHEILEQLQSAGCVEARGGRLGWTREGKRIREMLQHSMTTS